uniref:Uncharacterized protein n=1 Tax=Anopheles albimanus TaxID=7167 RepID=A0A182F2J9_ANOAL
MMLLVFRIFYVWPKRDMDPEAEYWYRLKGIVFRGFFIYLSVALQLVFLFTDAPIEEKIAAISLLLTEIVFIWKLEYFHRNISDIQELVLRLDGEMYRPQNEAEAEPLKRTRTSTTVTWMIYLILSDGVIVFWTVSGIRARRLVNPCWFPYDYNSSLWLYLLTIVYQYFALTFNASFNVTCDTLIGNLLALVDANLQRLEIQLKKDKILIVKPADCSKNMQDSTYNELLKCIIFHQELINYLSDILNMSGTTVLPQLFCSVFSLCITELCLLANKQSTEDSIGTIIHFGCLVMQVFMNCHYGNEITYTSKKVHQATAFVNYPDMDIKTRKLLILFQQRTSVELKCFAASLFKIELSMETFVTIIKSSYSYFAVL